MLRNSDPDRDPVFLALSRYWVNAQIHSIRDERENKMKSPNNNLLISNDSMHLSPVSKLSRIAFRLTLTAAVLGGLAVSGLSSHANAQAQSMSTAVLEHPNWAQLPGALIRPDCVHEIPKGARVEIGTDGNLTGDVTLKGELVAHYDSCPEQARLNTQADVEDRATGK